MNKTSSALSCDRGNDLVAFLYGEAGEREAHDFEHHLRTCAVCQSELSSFKQIRASIIEWRDESLGSFSTAVSPAMVNDSSAATVKRSSALAAIREFFNLSPLWLKGAVTFASLLFCITASLAVARLFEKPQMASNETGRYSEEEVDRKVRAAVELKERQLKELEAQKQNEPHPQAVAQNDSRPQRRNLRFKSKGSPEGTNAQTVPLTRAEREQLAADLRLTTPDEIGPSLLSDRINQEQ